MSESKLSYRGLAKLANAKLGYLIDLQQVENYQRKNGTTEELLRYQADLFDKYQNRVREIYAEDNKLKIEGDL